MTAARLGRTKRREGPRCTLVRIGSVFYDAKRPSRKCNVVSRASLVTVDCKHPGEGWCVFLGGIGEQPVCIGPFENPAVAREMADKVEQYLEALIRAVHGGPPTTA